MQELEEKTKTRNNRIEIEEQDRFQRRYSLYQNNYHIVYHMVYHTVYHTVNHRIKVPSSFVHSEFII